MLRLIAFALVPLALVAASAAAGNGGPAPGVVAGWDGAVDARERRSLRGPARGEDDCCRRGAHERRHVCSATRRSAARSAIPLVAFDGTAEGDLPRRQDARARGVRRERSRRASPS